MRFSSSLKSSDLKRFVLFIYNILNLGASLLTLSLHRVEVRIKRPIFSDDGFSFFLCHFASKDQVIQQLCFQVKINLSSVEQPEWHCLVRHLIKNFIRDLLFIKLNHFMEFFNQFFFIVITSQQQFEPFEETINFEGIRNLKYDVLGLDCYFLSLQSGNGIILKTALICLSDAVLFTEPLHYLINFEHLVEFYSESNFLVLVKFLLEFNIRVGFQGILVFISNIFLLFLATVSDSLLFLEPHRPISRLSVGIFLSVGFFQFFSFLYLQKEVEWIVAKHEELEGWLSLKISQRVSYPLDMNCLLLLLYLLLKAKHRLLHNLEVVDVLWGWLVFIIFVPFFIGLVVFVPSLLLFRIELHLELISHLLLERDVADEAQFRLNLTPILALNLLPVWSRKFPILIVTTSRRGWLELFNSS